MDITCSHCDAAVPVGGAVRYRGRAYHPHCRKCFTCGKLDLLGAETFEGVIFCSACAERIFADRARPRPLAASAAPRQPHHVRGEVDAPTVLFANVIPASVDQPSLDKITAQNAIDTKTEPAAALQTKLLSLLTDNLTSPAPPHPVQFPDRSPQLVTGDVPDVVAAPDTVAVKSASTEHKSTGADGGLAELGASVELAHVALRRPSSPSLTLVTKPGSAFCLEGNKSFSHDLIPGTSVSRRAGSCWWRKRFSSVLKIPFHLFKRNILDKSSFIAAYNRTEKPGSPFGLRDIFHNEIMTHHRRGAQVLYGTINRHAVPHKLGWVRAATGGTKHKRCRHYRASHSYRCLRAHAMRRAGPTRSELEQLRGRIKRCVRGELLGRLLREANLTNVRAG